MMRAIGTIAFLIGCFLLFAAVVAIIQSRFQMAGVEVFAIVSSVPGTLAVGAALALVGWWIRRRTGPR